MKVLGDRILLKVTQEEKVGSLYIPVTSMQVKNVGLIVQMGGDVKSRELEVGQIVMFDYYGAQRVTLENEEYFMIRSADIAVILEEAEG
jgi:co-chaperonin GroES (HSP10)